MKRIIYGVGTTATRAIVSFNKNCPAEMKTDTVFRVFDTDYKTHDCGLSKENEIVVVGEDNFRNKLDSIRESQNLQPEIYADLQRIIPIEDKNFIESRPQTQGAGSCKDPSVSATIGYLYRKTIQEAVRGDADLVAQSNSKKGREAYVLLSTCGGTSSGLHLTVIETLLKKNFKVFLILLSPSYFTRPSIQDDSEGKLKANTIASLLRIAFDKKKGKIEYMPDKPQTGTLYPIILESEWDSARYAEFNATERGPQSKAYADYVARTLLGFIYNNHNGKDQSWFSSYINDEEGIRQNQEYFNVLMTYPRFSNLKRVVKNCLNKIEAAGENTAEYNLLLLLKKHNVVSLDDAIATKPSLVKSVLQEAIQKELFPPKSLSDMLMLAKQRLILVSR